ncbi:putative nuclear transport factor 2 [Cardiosporidium cionae]|uniref:Nuclear transport factor 2 n=1 Tax=Cardiosporidium cionae TaxID=476202 RepID=A0ABQ7JAF5_9APIC|nr:putative nuclear transport factor 2 [Cardiosporidium cionae]|eukprot:KAF8820630.1 putative nuclear transport factor 2 [Cardiosporidium cionae]
MALNLNPQYESVGRQFVLHFYQTFSSNSFWEGLNATCFSFSQKDNEAKSTLVLNEPYKANLGGLYGPESMLTFENNQFQGPQSIMVKLNGLPPKVRHSIVTCDCQPTPHNGIIVFVAGDLAIDDDPPVKFAEAFHLVPSPTGSYIIFNDMFRFCIG